jgi:hypothetical protein
MPKIETVFTEVDGYAVAPLSSALVGEGGLQVCLRLPPGLAPGRHVVRLKIGRSGWSEVQEFFVDLPGVAELKLLSVQDGVTWTDNQVDWAGGGWLTVWVEGLTAEADMRNTTVEVGGIPHFPQAHIDLPGIQVNRFRKMGFIDYAGNEDDRLHVHTSLLNVVLHD